MYVESILFDQGTMWSNWTLVRPYLQKKEHLFVFYSKILNITKKKNQYLKFVFFDNGMDALSLELKKLALLKLIGAP